MAFGTEVGIARLASVLQLVHGFVRGNVKADFRGQEMRNVSLSETWNVSLTASDGIENGDEGLLRPQRDCELSGVRKATQRCGRGVTPAIYID